MLALGSLAPIKRPFLSKPKDQGFRYDSSVTVDHKDWNLNSSPDLIDKAVMVNLVSMVKETKQNTKIIMNQNFTIIASLSEVLKEILELKQSRNNDTFGDFAWDENSSYLLNSWASINIDVLIVLFTNNSMNKGSQYLMC